LRIKSCKSAQCWEVAQDYTVHCKVHHKMTQDQALALMQELNRSLGGKWFKFVSSLRMNAEQDDQGQIYLDSFKRVCQQHKLRLRED